MKHALSLLLAVGTTFAVTRQDPAAIEARELRLVDGQGRVRLLLSAEGLDGGAGARVELMDAQGRPAARLVLDDGPDQGALVGLELLEQGRPIAWLGRSTARDGDGAELRLLGQDGTPRVELSAAPSLWLRTPARRATAELRGLPEANFTVGRGERWESPHAPMVLQLEGGASGLRFEAREDASELQVRRGDGRYVRVVRGY